MPQVINTNVASLNSQRQLNSSQTALSTSLQRLSSGLRINSAKDDAAGLAISDRMTTQIRGLSQAARNANDGISLLQTADSALSSMTANLQRIRELSIQANNATNSQTDKAALQAEVSQLLAEIERVGTQSEFNGSALFFNSTTSVVGDANQLAVIDGLKSGWLENSEQMIADYFGLTADGAAISIELTTFSDGAGGVAAQVVSSIPATPPGKGSNLKLQIDMADFTPPNLPNGGTAPFYNDRIIAHEMVHAVMARTTNYSDLAQNSKWFVEGTAEFIHGADERLKSDIASAGSAQAVINGLDDGFQLNSQDYSASYGAVRFLHDQIKLAGGEGIKDVMTYLSANPSATLDDAFNSLASTYGGAIAGYTSEALFLADYDGGAGAAYLATLDLNNEDTGAVGGFDADGGAVLTAESVVNDVGSKYGADVTVGFSETFESIGGGTGRTNLAFQVGAQAGQTIEAGIGAMNLAALDIASVDLTTNPSRAISQMDRALDYINSERAVVGAQLNRLESTIANIQTTAENLSASRSRVLDTDFAAETASLTRAQVMQQTGVAMLAQANALPNNVLSLLR